MDLTLAPSPWAALAARNLGAVLLLALVGIAWHQRRALRQLGQSELFQRWLTWLAIVLLLGAATLGGPLALGLLLAACAWQATREYQRLAEAWPAALAASTPLPLGDTPRRFNDRLAPALAASTPLLVVAGAPLGLLPLLGLLALSLAALRRPTAFDLPAALLGYLWIAFGLAHVAALHLAHGPRAVVLVAAMVGLSDVGAFLLGRALGGPRLAPAVSPAKTWAGVAGNALGASAALGLLPFAVPAALGPAGLGLLVGLVALAAVVGDLLESRLKRAAGVKDAGHLLPGFGGLLDRVDSLLLAAPIAYWLLDLIQ